MLLPENYKRLIRLHSPYKGRICLALFCMALTAAAEPVIPYFFKMLIDYGFKEQIDFPYWYVPAVVIGLFFIRGAATYTTNYTMAWISSRVLTVLRKQMFARILDMSAGYFESFTVGKIMNSILSEVGQIIGMVTNILTSMIRSLLTVLGLMAYLFYIDWKLSLITFLLLPSVIYIVRRTGRRLKRLNQDSMKLGADLAQNLEEMTRAHQLIKIFDAQQYELKRFVNISEDIRRNTMRTTRTFSATVPITQLITAAAVSIIVLIALYQSRHGQISVGGFVSFITAMLMMLAPLKALTDVNGPLQRGLAAAESVFDLIDAPVERTDGEVLQNRARGKIEYRNLSFTYPSASRPALQNISLKVEPGETIALVGQSGGGKSTFVSLLPEFYPPTEGVIFLDDMPISKINLMSLRSQIAMVNQHVVLFNDTVAKNVAYGDDNPDLERIEEAIKAAYLTDVVNNLEHGLDTLIGHNGSRLSGGQRQRMAIARAIYKNAPILILDEATSALDTESEKEVQAALDQLMKGRTTFVIAHRLSTVEGASRIVVLSEGRIIEVGTHQELLELNGAYANLYRLQFSKESAG